MSRRKTERLLSLVVCLLSTRRYLTAEQIRQAVAGYPEQPEAFKRMFERDKEELRELGIPLETGPISPLDGEDTGYRVERQAYELPELRLEADEAAVLGLAARVWRHAELAGAAAGALLKLRAAGIDTDDPGSGTRQGIEPRVHTTEPAFGPLWEAVRDRRPVTFAYRAAGRSEPQTRELEPWGVVNRHGRWYVAGRDRDRDAVRVFRLSRIEGDVRFSGPAGGVTVPAGTDVREVVRTWDSAPPAEKKAVLRIRPGAGYGLRRYATSQPAVALAGDSPALPGDSAALTGDSAALAGDSAGSAVSGSAAGPARTGAWDTVTVLFSEVGWFADHVASFGPDVVVVDPPDLRDAVIRRLKGVLA